MCSGCIYISDWVFYDPNYLIPLEIFWWNYSSTDCWCTYCGVGVNNMILLKSLLFKTNFLLIGRQQNDHSLAAIIRENMHDDMQWRFCRVTGPLWGESNGDWWIILTKCWYCEVLWCFLWCWSQTAERSMISYVITFTWRHNVHVMSLSWAAFAQKCSTAVCKHSLIPLSVYFQSVFRGAQLKISQCWVR